MKKILVTGATGQMGGDLCSALRKKFGVDNILAAGHSRQPDQDLLDEGPFCRLEVRDLAALDEIVAENKIDTIFHMASMLSAVAEEKPHLAWNVNMNGLVNVLETALVYNCSVFFPSSIAAFGPQTPRLDTPQVTIQRPNSMYGINKVSGELLCDYYYHRFGLDTRGLRYPGLISYKTLPGGGTTDYAVEIFYAALKTGHYECYLKPDTQLDMMYMPDAINAAIKLMTTDADRLVHRNAYNVTAMSFNPYQLAQAINKQLPDFTIAYKVDPVRQAIADSWPQHMNDSVAHNEWGWQAQYDLSMMVMDMLKKLSVKAKTAQSGIQT